MKNNDPGDLIAALSAIKQSTYRQLPKRLSAGAVTPFPSCRISEVQAASVGLAASVFG
jgi:hypothetical protein